MYQARGPPADIDLLAGQPHGEEGEGPGDERGGGGGHHVGREPLADVVQPGDGGGDADDAREEREDDEEPRRQVADREVDREQAHRRGHALHCTNKPTAANSKLSGEVIHGEQVRARRRPGRSRGLASLRESLLSSML